MRVRSSLSPSQDRLGYGCGGDNEEEEDPNVLMDLRFF
jgi:hypothetical protein